MAGARSVARGLGAAKTTGKRVRLSIPPGRRRSVRVGAAVAGEVVGADGFEDDAAVGAGRDHGVGDALLGGADDDALPAAEAAGLAGGAHRGRAVGVLLDELRVERAAVEDGHGLDAEAGA